MRHQCLTAKVLILTCLGGLMIPAPVRAKEKELNLWPLVYSRESQDGKKSELEFLWPFVTAERTGGTKEWGLHPLFSVRKEEGKGKDVQVLWPLLSRKEDDRTSSLRLLPFLYDRAWVDEDGKEGTRLYIFPFYYRGKNPDGESSAAVFPLGGRVTRFLGQDEITFVCFPLWVSWNRGEHVGHAVLWPVIGWSSGGGVEGFKVLPFYARREDENKGIWTVAVLWPIFVRTGSQDGSVSGFMIFPFYGRVTAGKSSSRMAPWPFFVRTFGEEKKEHELPWPIFRYATGPDLYELRIWPLWGGTHSPGRVSYFALWPLAGMNMEQNPSTERRGLWVLPFLVGNIKVTDGEKSSSHILWPAASWQKSPQGAGAKGLCPLWNINPERGIERNYEIFWTLFRYRRADDERELRILGRLITHRQSEERNLVELVHLFRYEREGGEKSVRLFKGLLGYESGEEGKRLRVLWAIKIPLGKRR